MFTSTMLPAHSVVASEAKPLEDGYDELLERIGSAEIVLIGEASHGTHEFYANRARLTRRLIAEKGFSIVALEADWPDALRVNRYVSGRSADTSANQSLSGFRRFPTWMWRNTVMEEFVDWMREGNSGSIGRGAARIFGMDLYSMHTSMDAVLSYLSDVDPEAARRASERYSCFDHFGSDLQHYGYMTSGWGAESCEQEVVDQLMELRERRAELIHRDGKSSRL